MSDLAARAAAWLSARGSVRAWRVVLAAAAGALSAGAMWGGLASWLPPLQAGVLAALTAGLVAPSLASAAAAGSVAAVAGGLLAPQNAWVLEVSGGERALSLVVAAVVAAVAGAGVRSAARRWRPAGGALVGLALAVVLANLWGNALTTNSQRTYDPLSGVAMPSFNEQLAGALPQAIADSDDAWFFRVYEEVGGGRGYYDAFAWALDENPRWGPYSVMDFRMPTFFLLSRVVPPRSLPVAFLVLATCAVVAVVAIGASVARLPLAIPAAAAVAAYLLFFPMQLHLFSPESTAAAIGVLAVAALLRSYGSSRWRAWCATAAVLAVLATLVRETIVFVPLGGLAAAVGPSSERRFRVAWWSAGVAALGLAYLAHYLVTRPLVTSLAGTGRAGKGGLANVFGAIVYGTDFLGGVNVLVVALAVLGVLGALLLPDAQRRVFAAVAVIAPLLSFLVLGNRAWYEATGAQVNYWGATVVPLLYALVPAALAVVPGAARGMPGTGTGAGAAEGMRVRSRAAEQRRPGEASARKRARVSARHARGSSVTSLRRRSLRYTARMNTRAHTLHAGLLGRLMRPAAVIR